MRNSPLEEELISRFMATHKGPPVWPWRYAPSIPLIGRGYKPGRGLLVYASAEYLSWMRNRRHRRWQFFKEPIAWNRYRAQYESLGQEPDPFFPDIGISPVTNGGLLAAALFVAHARRLPKAQKPCGFLEKIAVTNWYKSGVHSRRRQAGREKLEKSLPFVEHELKELRPKVAIVPKTIWDRAGVKIAMREASPKTEFLPLYQFVPWVVNKHLERYSSRPKRLRGQPAGRPLAKWMVKLQKLNEANAWRYIAYLKEQLRRPKST